MARGILPQVEVNRLGATAAAEVTGDPVNFHTTVNDGDVEVIVRNSGSTVSRTVTFQFDPGLSAGLDGSVVPGRAYAIPIGVTKKFYGFPVATYGVALNIDVDNAELKLSAEHKV